MERIPPEDGFLPAVSHGYQNDLGFGQLFHSSHIVLSPGREIPEIAGLLQLCLPSRVFLINGFARLQDMNLGGDIFQALSPIFVSRADADRFELAEHVHFGKGDTRQSVQPDRVPQKRDVEPSAATGPARGRAELAASLADPLSQVIVQLGGERSPSHPGSVSLGDPDDLGNFRWTHSGPGTGSPGYRIGGGYVG